MKSYQWTVPERLIEAVKNDVASVPDRVQKYLINQGLQVEGVTVLNRIRVESISGDFTYIDGPFLRVEADRDPAPELNAITLDPPAPNPNRVVIRNFLQAVDQGVQPTQAATINVVIAIARLIENGR